MRFERASGTFNARPPVAPKAEATAAGWPPKMGPPLLWPGCVRDAGDRQARTTSPECISVDLKPDDRHSTGDSPGARPTVRRGSNRPSPCRMDPYRFGFTTDRYGRGFGYSCKDVFECQALKEKQELAAESYRAFSPQSFAAPPPLAAYREPTMAERAPSGHQRGGAPPARFAPAPRLPPISPYW
ncbi:hypothetical protein HPB52_011118 [Rhipicephalus sanguineus]|uniref:Uncharacterized protein n=1 Tax=Rhipicephalus sanguineus TaxID=34632 RepID=A0A9D4T9I9_RHISA|nr:hypothetical protein HPB52_011118 [Rhipicephalus sanguineus]